MSLDWYLGKIENYEEVCFSTNENGEDILNPRTEALIWLTMAVDMGKITKENAADFYARVSFYESLFNPLLSSFEDGKQVYHPITPQDVKNHIGLSTNVAKDTDAAWRKRVFNNFVRDARAKFNIQTKEKTV